MVIKEGYDPLLIQEVMSYFFGVGKSEVEVATKQDQDTFLDLLENPNGEYLALDFLNCWLVGRGIGGIPDNLLNYIKDSGNLKKDKKGPKKKSKKEIK